ncbi:MAG: DUF3352 domain-containing protein [Acidimicrobiia bacterium]|nr:DUF3352 domain-containing protein [Acidimicrobiia bacterium]
MTDTPNQQPASEPTPVPVPGGTGLEEGQGAPAAEPGGFIAPTPVRARRRRWPWMVALAAVAVLGGAAWAFSAVLGGGGPQPAEALPASTDFYFRLDLDPSPAQKIAAVRLARRFPALQGLADDLEGDLKQALFEAAAGQDPDFAEEFDYEDDIEPWLGDRTGIGVILDDPARPIPVAVLQVSDPDAAAEILPRLLTFEQSSEPAGFAFVGDYALIAEDQNLADRYAAEAEAGSLADSDNFAQVHGALGDLGIASMWMDADLDDLMSSGFTAAGDPATVGAMPAATQPGQGRLTMAAAVRLDAEHVDLAGVVVPSDELMALLPQSAPAGDADAAARIGRLPATTLLGIAIAGVDLSADERARLWDQLTSNQSGPEFGQFAAELEEQFGITLPDDYFDLFSNDITLSLDMAIFDFEESFGVGAAGFPFAAIFDTTAASGREAVTKLVGLVETSGFELAVEDDDSTIVVAASGDYLRTLTGEATALLSDSGEAARAVGTDDPVNMAMFLNVEALIDELGVGGALAGSVSDEVRENLEPFQTVGITAWWDDLGGDDAGSSNFRIRVTVGEEE